MLSPKIDYTGPWERVRQCLIDDMEHIRAAINQRWAATFGDTNTVPVAAGGTGAGTLTAHGILVGEGANPIVSVTGSGVVHATIGADPTISPVVEGDLSTSDLTTANVTSTKHGFAPKSPADATEFLNGAATPAYALVKDSDLSTSDITTNNVSTSKHGFAPKAPNDATKFLDGTGAYSAPPDVSIPLIGGVSPATTGKRVTWLQKGDAVNSSTMIAVGQAAATITGGSGVFDTVGFWARATSTAGNAARFSAASAFTRFNLLPKLIVRLRTNSAITSTRILVGLNESMAGVDTDTPNTGTQRGIYVRYSTAIPDGGWVVQTVDGSGRTTSGTILAIAASTVYVITITTVSTTSVNVDINGTTVNVTANIVLGVSLGYEVLVRDLAAATQSIEVESIYLSSQ
jgi:hypothetical protein